MDAIVNNLIKAIGWSIFHSLWQGAIIYGILLMLLSLFPKLNSKIKHNLAYGTLCLIFVGFCITFSSVFQLPEENGSRETPVFAERNYQESLFTIPQQLTSSTEYIFPYLAGIYIIGLLSQLFILTIGYQKVLRLKQAARMAVPFEWQAVFSEMVERLNLRRNIGFYLSDKVNVPLVIGYLKPVVLFPVALATQLDIKQVEAILIHELSHIRRNDYLLNLIKTGIETLLFFNPFIWLTSKFIGVEREHACDDLVLKFTGTPLTYAHALLKLEILKDKTTPSLSMAASGNNQHLYQRIKRITDMKTNYMNAKQQFFAITLTVATVISLAWISPEKTTASSTKSQTPDVAPEVKPTVKKHQIKLVEIKTTTCNDTHADTTKKKRKFKIVTVDAQGNQKEYNSVKEMPDSLRMDIINDTFMGHDLAATFKGIPADFEKAFKTLGSASGIKLDSALTLKYKGNMSTEDYQKHINSARLQINKAIKLATTKSISNAEIAKVYNKALKDAEKAITYSFKYQTNPKADKQLDSIIIKTGNHVLKTRGDVSVALRNMSDHRALAQLRAELEGMDALRATEEYKKAKKKFDSEIEKIKRKKGIKTPSNSAGSTLEINGIPSITIEKP